MSRFLATLLMTTLAAVMAFAVVAYAGDPLGLSREHDRVVGYGQVSYDGAGPERWAMRYRDARAELGKLRRRLRVERRILLSRPSVVEAINLAAATYGYSSTLWRKAGCETGGTFSARSLNSSSGASGLFQFLRSTWASTPYRRFSIWSPYANALAAGWMHAHGRGGEWACR